MISVRGLPILVNEIDILHTIRDQVFQQQGRQILSKIKKSGNNIMVCCPVHSNGQERKPSCGIITVERNGYPPGSFNCFACGEKGTFELFVSKCFGYDDPKFGENWLLDNFITGELYERPDIPKDFERHPFLKSSKFTKNYVTEEELASYRYIHPYMYQRKLTDEVIEKYDVGYQKDFRLKTKNEDGTEKIWPPVECLTFPVKDKDGNCLFVSRRAIYNKNFFLPPDIEKPVYGIFELPKDCKTAIICESVINALTCVGYGIPALALFGTGDESQIFQLNQLSVRHYILGLDPDKAGNNGVYKLKKHLKNKLLTKLILPKDKDINDLTKEEFFSLQEVII